MGMHLLKSMKIASEWKCWQFFLSCISVFYLLRRFGIGCAISYRIYWYDDETVAIICFVCHHLLRQRLLSVPFVETIAIPYPKHSGQTLANTTERRWNEWNEKAYTEFVSFIPLTEENCNSWSDVIARDKTFLICEWTECKALILDFSEKQIE